MSNNVKIVQPGVMHLSTYYDLRVNYLCFHIFTTKVLKVLEIDSQMHEKLK